jgi:hypothetical protein
MAIVGAAAAIVGLGWTGCAGDAFTVQGATGSSGSMGMSSAIGPSSGSSSAIGGPVDASTIDASTHFCSNYTSYLLCEAFDDGAPGQLLELAQDAAVVGTYETDPDASVPPSKQSMQVTTPQVTVMGASARTLAGKSFTMTASDLSLEADFNVGLNCIADDVAVAIVTASLPAAAEPQYSVVLTVGPSGWSIVEILASPDGGTALSPHSAGAVLSADQWTNVKLTVHLLKKTVDLTLGSTALSTITLSETPLFTATGINASFAVGAAVTDVDAEARACDLEIDNVLFNDSATP